MTMSCSTQSKNVRIAGLVIPTDVNRYGRAVEVGIETASFERYIVGEGWKGKELFDFISKEVVALGKIVGKNSEGIPVLKVRKYVIKN